MHTRSAIGPAAGVRRSSTKPPDRPATPGGGRLRRGGPWCWVSGRRRDEMRRGGMMAVGKERVVVDGEPGEGIGASGR